MPMSKNRHSFFRNMMVRILFYGLFLVGPCALTESHAQYIRMKEKSSWADGVNENEKVCQEYKHKIALLGAIGILALGLWFAWFGFAFWGQIIHIMKERRSTQTRKSAITSPQNHQP